MLGPGIPTPCSTVYGRLSSWPTRHVSIQTFLRSDPSQAVRNCQERFHIAASRRTLPVLSSPEPCETRTIALVLMTKDSPYTPSRVHIYFGSIYTKRGQSTKLKGRNITPSCLIRRRRENQTATFLSLYARRRFRDRFPLSRFCQKKRTGFGYKSYSGLCRLFLKKPYFFSEKPNFGSRSCHIPTVSPHTHESYLPL